MPEYFTALELLEDETPAEPEFIPFMGLPGFVERGASHLFTSDARLGKTTVITQALPWWTANGDTVLVISEEGRDQWITRIKRLRESKPDAILDGIRFLRARTVMPPGSIPLLQEIVDSPETIVIADTLRGLLLPDNENDNSEMGRLIVPWIGAFQDTGRTLIFTHHMVKSRNKQKGRGLSIAGAGSIVSHFDNHLEMWERTDRRPGREITLFSRKLRYAEMSWEWIDDGISWDTLKGTTQAGPSSEKFVLDLLADGTLRESPEIEREMARGGITMSSEGVRKLLLRLDKRGKVYRDPPTGEPLRGQKLLWGLKRNVLI